MTNAVSRPLRGETHSRTAATMMQVAGGQKRKLRDQQHVIDGLRTRIRVLEEAAERNGSLIRVLKGLLQKAVTTGSKMMGPRAFRRYVWRAARGKVVPKGSPVPQFVIDQVGVYLSHKNVNIATIEAEIGDNKPRPVLYPSGIAVQKLVGEASYMQTQSLRYLGTTP